MDCWGVLLLLLLLLLDNYKHARALCLC